MAHTAVKYLRSEFQFPNIQRINWYPGHMVKATRIMCDRLKMVDYVIEVRDARLPFTGVNAVFDEEVQKRNKPRLLIFNKADLCHPSQQTIIRKHVTADDNNRTAVLFTSAKDGTNIRNIVKATLDKFPVQKKFKTIPYMFMIAGIPNVGKSSIINALRLRNRVLNENSGTGGNLYSAGTSTKSAKSGATPGVTRDVNSFLVSLKPRCLLMDTPGVLFPSLDSHEHAFKLALINALPDQLLSVGPELLVDFLLYTMNRNQYFDYVKLFKLDAPVDNLDILLSEYVCPQLNAIGPQGEPNKVKASLHLLKMFREGKLGKIVLDDI